MKFRSQLFVPAALAAVFLAPLVVAWAIYHQPAWHPRGGLQHGELLSPAQRFAAPPLITAAGEQLEPSLFQGRWTLLYRSAGQCDHACRVLMDTLGRVRLAQGRAMNRVQRVLVEPGPLVADANLAGGDLQVAAAARWPLPSGSVYLLDPGGNLVLRYRPGFDPQGLLKDLQHLLRATGEG
jgi:cytochrome oxidase Cu insertion factor (SCO1/SenC/PrrC family)